jgi:hypothetical protein
MATAQDGGTEICVGSTPLGIVVETFNGDK